MSTRSYNQFFPGIKRDDFLTIGSNFIEGKNVTGLRNGYAATLGPKIQKQILTNNPIYGIFGLLSISSGWYGVGSNETDTGEIYRLNGSDNTPVETLTAVDTAYWNLKTGISFGGQYYFVGKLGASGSYNIHRIPTFNADADNWTGNWIFNVGTPKANSEIPPILVENEYIYIGFNDQIQRFDKSEVRTDFSLFNGNVVGITKHGTMFLVYTDKGIVSYWDGVTSTIPAVNKLGFIPRKVVQEGAVDYITTADGELRIGSGYQTQRIGQVIKSNRLEDNSQYITKMNFSFAQSGINEGLQIVKGGLIALTNDSIPTIYQYDSIVPGLAKGFHSISSQDSQNEDYENLYNITYARKDNILYICRTANGITGIDKIDLSSLETAKDGYLVSDVFSGGTAFEKEIEVIRFAKSFVSSSGSNFIKLYKRINNGAWEEIILTTTSDDTITRENLTLVTDEWIDIQFKIELHNDSQDDTPPFFNELSHDYTIIKR